jgi:hypothetical protein
MTATEVTTRAIGWTLGLLLAPVASVLVRLVHGPDVTYEWEEE